MEVDQGEPCPFVYAKGRKCTGHVWRIEAFKVDISWSRADDGKWSFAVGEPRSHYQPRRKVTTWDRGHRSLHCARQAGRMLDGKERETDAP